MLESETRWLTGNKDDTRYFDIRAAWLLTYCKILNNDTGSPAAGVLWEAEDIFKFRTDLKPAFYSGLSLSRVMDDTGSDNILDQRQELYKTIC